jgi:Zinc dependent phospholipase C
VSLHRICAFLLSMAAVSAALPCSVLSHEAVVDAMWDVKLQPLLRSLYPDATPEDLKRAHGFAYGGAIIQDLGYYPHGTKKFSDMTHYVRTGDFVLALLRESKSLEELAFALGALSHYSSDIDVHKSATNPGEAILYPKLKRRFGPVITYEEDPAAHLKTEFGFDVLEVAKGRFAPEAYHDFIGFNVANDLLARAFEDTYGVPITQIFSNFDHAIGSYRRAVSNWIPRATRVAWAQREGEIQHSQPGITRHRFVYTMRRSSYERDWGKNYDRPTAWDRFLAVLLKIIPPVGPLRALQFKMPTPPVEVLFMQSFDRCIHQYGDQIDAEQRKSLQLVDVNYDLGGPAKPGDYKLQDEAYAFWIDQLAQNRFAGARPDVRNAILGYYSDAAAAKAAKLDPKSSAKLQSELQALLAATKASVSFRGAPPQVASVH